MPICPGLVSKWHPMSCSKHSGRSPLFFVKCFLVILSFFFPQESKCKAVLEMCSASLLYRHRIRLNFLFCRTVAIGSWLAMLTISSLVICVSQNTLMFFLRHLMWNVDILLKSHCHSPSFCAVKESWTYAAVVNSNLCFCCILLWSPDIAKQDVSCFADSSLDVFASTSIISYNALQLCKIFSDWKVFSVHLDFSRGLDVHDLLLLKIIAYITQPYRTPVFNSNSIQMGYCLLCKWSVPSTCFLIILLSSIVCQVSSVIHSFCSFWFVLSHVSVVFKYAVVTCSHLQLMSSAWVGQ